jgi:uncharacterized protein (DUF58 family)
MPNPLTPPSVEDRARGRKPLSFGFGPRFFVALLIGFVWLVPAWWSPRFITGMFLWDALALVAWFFDLLRLPAPSALTVSRTWSGPLILGRPVSAGIGIQNFGRVPVSATLVDRTPPALRHEPPVLTAIVRPAFPALQQYTIVPRERGEAALGELFLRYRSALGFAERWAVAPLAQTVCVLPDLLQAEEQALLLIRSRQVEMEKRRRRQPGMGREFESLREYREGDEFRDISWSATARRHQLITRTYTAERSQAVWIAVDAGRLLRARIQEAGRDVHFSKLDYAVNAALSVAQVASQHGDRVGLVAYGRSIQQSAAPGRGPLHIRTLVDALARVRSEPGEADHARAARTITQKQTRRSLVIWITDFAETPATPDVIEYSAQLGKRHLVLFAAIGQPDLAAAAQTIPETEAEMFRQAAALEIVDRRDLLLRKLRQTGVLALELAPGRLTTSLVNEYLQIKDRGLL